MISTKNVNADERIKAGRLNIVTTRTIDASLKTVPKKDWKKNTNKLISTHNMEDVAAIGEKKKVLEIVAQRNEYQKKLKAEKKKIVKAEAAKAKRAKDKKTKRNDFQEKLDIQKKRTTRAKAVKHRPSLRYAGGEPKMERHSIKEKEKNEKIKKIPSN